MGATAIVSELQIFYVSILYSRLGCHILNLVLLLLLQVVLIISTNHLFNHLLVDVVLNIESGSVVARISLI